MYEFKRSTWTRHTFPSRCFHIVRPSAPVRWFPCFRDDKQVNDCVNGHCRFSLVVVSLQVTVDPRGLSPFKGDCLFSNMYAKRLHWSKHIDRLNSWMFTIKGGSVSVWADELFIHWRCRMCKTTPDCHSVKTLSFKAGEPLNKVLTWSPCDKMLFTCAVRLQSRFLVWSDHVCF